MKSSFILKIEKPCTENWDSMIVNDRGKFCSSCQENIIDFSTCSDDEIIRILENTKGNVCGRLRKSQLEKIFVATQNRKVSPHLNKILAGLFALGLTAVTESNAQTVNVKTTWSPDTTNNVVAKNNSTENNSVHKSKTEKQDVKYVISGKIIELYDSLPINNAIVNMKNQEVAVYTDSTGKFSLTIPIYLATDTITLVISRVDYETKEIKVAKSDFNTPLTIRLNEMIVMGRMVPYYTPKDEYPVDKPK
jgi:hypothetical protein